MDIKRIEYISPLLYQVPIKPKKVCKNIDYLEIKDIESKDNNLNRHEEHDAMYYYNLMKNEHHKDIKQVDEKTK